MPGEQHPQPVPEILDTTFSVSAIVGPNGQAPDNMTNYNELGASQESALRNLMDYPHINETD